jgi:hypothetical protein
MGYVTLMREMRNKYNELFGKDVSHRIFKQKSVIHYTMNAMSRSTVVDKVPLFFQ